MLPKTQFWKIPFIACGHDAASVLLQPLLVEKTLHCPASCACTNNRLCDHHSFQLRSQLNSMLMALPTIILNFR